MDEATRKAANRIRLATGCEDHWLAKVIEMTDEEFQAFMGYKPGERRAVKHHAR